MGKKFASDTVYTTPAAAMRGFNETIAAMATNFPGLDPLSIAHTNLSNVLTPNPDDPTQVIEVSPLSFDTDNRLTLTDPTKAGTLATVILYGTGTIPQTEGEPLAIPEAVYLVNLPTYAEIATAPGLHEYREKLFARALLTAARNTAKAHHANRKQDGEGNVTFARPMQADRIAALLATLSRSANSELAAYKVAFPALQSVIIKQADATAEALKARGRSADAKVILATYSKARLSSDTLRQCFSSAAAAKVHFPGMAQEQWEKLISYAITKLAPACPVRVLVKDAEGNTVKDAEGKNTYRTDRVQINPAIFEHWQRTRAEVTLADQSEALTFDGLTA